MASPKPVSDTVKRMKDHSPSLTFGWDVVVNYSVEPINKLLAATHKDKPQIKDLKFKFNDYNPESDAYYDIHYDFGLGAPVISFQPRDKNAMCTLTIPILNGTVKVDGKEPVSVTSGVYSLRLSNLKLAVDSAKGSWESTGSACDNASMFVFHDGNTTDGHVIIDLQASNKLVVSIEKSNNVSATGIASIDNRVPDLVRLIKGLLHSDSLEDPKRSDGLYKSVRYEIARVNPSAPSEGYQMQPKLFLFDAFKESDTASEDDGGILSLFIHCTTANPPKSDELFTSWHNQWRVMLGCSPIPQGETASIIISKKLIYEKVLEPAIEAKGYTVVRSDEDSSIKMEIDTKKKIDCDMWTEVDLTSFRQVGGVHVDVPALTLKSTERDSFGGSEISWKLNYSFDWTIQMSSPWGSFPHTKEATLTHEIKKKFNKLVVLDDRHLVMDCSISSTDWSVSSTHKLDWRAPRVTLPDFKMTLVDINFFLTTNLMFPDDKQVIDIDKNSGLHIPGDFYLVGTVKEV